jgi:hypothetical protein
LRLSNPDATLHQPRLAMIGNVGWIGFLIDVAEAIRRLD